MMFGIVLIGLVLIGIVQGQMVSPLRFATGPKGGTYLAIGNALGPWLNGNGGDPNLRLEALSTAGSMENLQGLRDGRFELALVQADLAQAAYNGANIADFASKPAGNLRALAALYPEVVHLVVRIDSSIKGVADLAGKRLVLGEAGSGSEQNALQVLSAYGLSERNLAAGTGRRARPEEASLLLQQGDVDGFFLTTGLDNQVIVQLASISKVRLVPIEARSSLVNPNSAFQPTLIPAYEYNGMPDPTPSVSVTALWVTRNEVANGVIKGVLQAAFRNELGFKRLYPVLDRYFSLKHAAGLVSDAVGSSVTIPLHPEAELYYRQAGVEIPMLR
jgi:uncharacterized protein